MSSGPSGYSLPLASEDIRQRSSWNVEELSSDPAVYRVVENNDKQFFMTVIQGCGYNEEEFSHAITRQLFVGFSDLRVQRKSSIQYDNYQALQWLVHAKLDDTPVLLSTYSQFENECVTDYVFWTPQNTEDGVVSEDQFLSLSRNFIPYIEPLISNKKTG